MVASGPAPQESTRGVGFQSPSLRGSGRFAQERARKEIEARSFNPLHCGAVVASASRMPRTSTSRPVSIPFIAGQWSLRPRPQRARRPRPRFNPLHCGAVVASRRDRGSAGRHRAGFNPLHCGAVVASSTSACARACARAFQSPSLRGSGRFYQVVFWGLVGYRVSIPFIAGQWSLLLVRTVGVYQVVLFQSPSLRGSGRFLIGVTFVISQCSVSIPFIAGQWSLHVGASGAHTACRLFQSPSLRGSGRFRSAPPPPKGGGRCFNPLHCGAVVASCAETGSSRFGP